jgi:DNA mismatch repair ATPase MutS
VSGIPSSKRGSKFKCRYLRQLNIDRDIVSMKNFNIYDPMKKGEGLVLDGQTLAHLEILLNGEGTDEGSLLKLLGRCVTPFGSSTVRFLSPLSTLDTGCRKAPVPHLAMHAFARDLCH